MTRQQTLTELKQLLEKYQVLPIIVEGKKDAAALQALGFLHIFILNEHHGSLRERIERITSELIKKESICLLFDNDKAGRHLISQCAPILRELGIRINQTLRNTLIEADVSHIEGMYKFLKIL